MADEPQTDWAIQSTPPPPSGAVPPAPSGAVPPSGAVAPVAGAHPAAPRPAASPRRRTGLIVAVVVGTLLLVVIGLLASLVFGPRADAVCDGAQSSCRLTLTGRGAQVDLTTAKGHRLIRQDGIDGAVATVGVEGEQQSCRAGQVLHAADLTVRCDQISDDTLILTVRH